MITPIILGVLFLWMVFSYKRTIIHKRVDGKKKPYLIRTTLLSCKLFTVKLHKALISDNEEAHDHPWNYMSIILWGGYFEETTTITHTYHYGGPGILEDNGTTITKTSKWFGPGSILFRNGTKLHRLIIPEGKWSLSLIITTPKWRKWGYLKHDTYITSPVQN